jgi:hypothetical protein
MWKGVIDMDPRQMMKQMFDFNKAAFEKMFSTMVVAQDQTEKMINMGLNQNKLMPEAGKKAIAEWVNACRKNSEDFKAKFDEGCRNMEGFFSVPEK